jgi:hypothetical protein
VQHNRGGSGNAWGSALSEKWKKIKKKSRENPKGIG